MKEISEDNYIGKCFRVILPNGILTAFKCNYHEGDFIGNDTFGAIYNKKFCISYEELY